MQKSFKIMATAILFFSALSATFAQHPTATISVADKSCGSRTLQFAQTNVHNEIIVTLPMVTQCSDDNDPATKMVGENLVVGDAYFGLIEMPKLKSDEVLTAYTPESGAVIIQSAPFYFVLGDKQSASFVIQKYNKLPSSDKVTAKKQ